MYIPPAIFEYYTTDFGGFQFFSGKNFEKKQNQ